MGGVDSFMHFGGKQNSKIPALYSPQDCEDDGFDSWSIPMTRLCYMVQLILRKRAWDFPGGPVVKTPHSQCRGLRFNPWFGN